MASLGRPSERIFTPMKDSYIRPPGSLKKKKEKSPGSATTINRSPSQIPRGRGNRQNQTSAYRTNVRKVLRLALSEAMTLQDSNTRVGAQTISGHHVVTFSLNYLGPLMLIQFQIYMIIFQIKRFEMACTKCEGANLPACLCIHVTTFVFFAL